MNHSKYQKELGSTAVCTKRKMEATKGIGQKSIQGGTEDCFFFDSWFTSKKAEEASMDVGVELIGTVKTNTKGLFKDTIEKLTKKLAWRFLPHVEEKSYVTWGQAAYCYRLQV